MIFQHCEVRWRDLRARGRPRPDPKVREPGCADTQGGHHVHPPQPQFADAGQRHRPAQAPRSSRAQGWRVPGVPASKGRQPRGRQTVHGHRIRVYGRSRPDPVAYQGGRDPGGQWHGVHPQDKRGHREDIHTSGQQLLRRWWGRKRCLSGELRVRWLSVRLIVYYNIIAIRTVNWILYITKKMQFESQKIHLKFQ